MRRTYAQPLSLELLAEHVPAVQRGVEVAKEMQQVNELFLQDPQNPLLKKQKRALQKELRASDKAQEILFISALPLIKFLASQEFNRRKAWSSRVPFDDIFNEAIAGFIRGLHSYKPANTKNSATNYLGQWITTTIRRKAEVLEHDFYIPYETVEKNRRIVAVRSKLSDQLGRPPTDEELLDSLNSVKKFIDGQWVNDPSAEGQRKTNKFTQEHLDLVNQLSNKLYGVNSNEPSTAEEENSYERASDSISASSPTSVEAIDEQSVQETKSQFFLNVFISMRMGSRQKDIILRHFGMAPYADEYSVKEIAEQTKLSTRFIKQIIMTFSQYMPVQGGVFHEEILKLSEETVYDLELEWLIPLLGAWPTGLNTPVPPPIALTTSK